MNSYTIDTNVLVVANLKNENASREQCYSTIEFLQSVVGDKKIISIDSLGLILEEYRPYASHRGAPGVGDAFFKWLHNNIGSNLCEKVDIVRTQHEYFEFEELLGIEALQGFDRSDQKFVAVAMKSENECVICNALDSDWDNYADAFEEIGITILKVSE